MARLLQASRASNRISNVVRAWLALRRQRWRRGGGSAGGVPPAVVLDPATFFACLADPAWVSVRLSWSFGSAGFAGGTFEVAKQGSGGGNFVQIGVVSVADAISSSGGVSSYQFTDDHGTDTYALLHYRVRCVCAGNQGAWSDACDVDINFRNYAFP